MYKYLHDFNDIYWKEDPSHPSDIIPAALSAAERVDASMKEVIVAITSCVMAANPTDGWCAFCCSR